MKSQNLADIYHRTYIRMMETDPKLVILVISNQINGQELFRVHVHELSIRFDEKFQEGIENNDELKLEIDSLNQMWRKQKIQQEQIFPIMLDIMTRHGHYMKRFFFDESELDSTGQFIDKPVEKQSTSTKTEAFFNSLKNKKLLRKIKKAEFQTNIKSWTVASKYVDCYAPKSCYYHYQMFKTLPMREDWYFMETDGRLNICFLNK